MAQPLPTRTRTDRFGDSWTVFTGPDARRLRLQIEAEQDEALARYHADPSPENLAALLSHDGIQEEIARRWEAEQAKLSTLKNRKAA